MVETRSGKSYLKSGKSENDEVEVNLTLDDGKLGQPASESTVQDNVVTSLQDVTLCQDVASQQEVRLRQNATSSLMQTSIAHGDVTSLLRGRAVTLAQGSDNKTYLILQQPVLPVNDVNNSATTVQVVTLKRTNPSNNNAAEDTLLQIDVDGNNDVMKMCDNDVTKVSNMESDTNKNTDSAFTARDENTETLRTSTETVLHVTETEGGDKCR